MRKIRQYPTMAGWFPRFVLCLLAAIATAAAERSPADWLQEISAAYAKQESFIVTYTSSGENKSLEVTIGLEHKASLTVFHMIGIKNGRKDEIRQGTHRTIISICLAPLA